MIKPIKIKKINSDWYNIVVKTDKWDCPIEVVSILRTNYNEWSVIHCDDYQLKRPVDIMRDVFVKLSDAKEYARELSAVVMGYNQLQFEKNL